jgi:DNA repair exonuclease SbcCD nuclease subunit
MKIALITDTHWGVRNDNAAFLDNSKKFLDNIFFPYIDLHRIHNVVHLGDLVDRRKYININTAKRLREDFLQPIKDRGINMHLIAGNHDTYYKNTNSVNALREIVRGYDDLKNWFIYDQLPREVDFAGTIVMMMPWICDENRKLSLEKLKNTNAQIIMGHLEIAGFEMYRGSLVSHGEDRRILIWCSAVTITIVPLMAAYIIWAVMESLRGLIMTILEAFTFSTHKRES